MGQFADPKAIRTAPSGQYRVVHEDARDHVETLESDHPDLPAAQAAIQKGLAPWVAELAIYDDQGRRQSF